jgi:hypothetical protein
MALNFCLRILSTTTQLHRVGDGSTAEGAHIRDNNTARTSENYTKTGIHPHRRKCRANRSFRRVDDTRTGFNWFLLNLIRTDLCRFLIFSYVIKVI